MAPQPISAFEAWRRISPANCSNCGERRRGCTRIASLVPLERQALLSEVCKRAWRRSLTAAEETHNVGLADRLHLRVPLVTAPAGSRHY